MINLLDGPCKGILHCNRLPVFLRAVKDTNGEIDALDQLEDKVKETEMVFIYQRQGEVLRAHLYYGGGRGEWVNSANYSYMPDIDGEQFRDNSTWRSWCQSQVIMDIGK